MVFAAYFAILALVVGIAIGFAVGWKIMKYRMGLSFREQIESEREDAVRKSRYVLTGKLTEQISPYLPDFPYDPTEVRFIGAPIDFVVFKGLSQREISEVVFLEVKTGTGSLSHTEKSLKESVRSGRVKWEEYHASVPTGEKKGS